MKNVKNLQYFTTITFFILSILFTVTSSVASINFNLDGSKNVIANLESLSAIVNWNLLSLAYSQEDDFGEEEVEQEEVEKEEVEQEEVEQEEVEQEEVEDKEKENDDKEASNQSEIGFSIPFEPENP